MLKITLHVFAQDDIWFIWGVDYQWEVKLMQFILEHGSIGCVVNLQLKSPYMYTYACKQYIHLRFLIHQRRYTSALCSDISVQINLKVVMQHGSIGCVANLQLKSPNMCDHTYARKHYIHLRFLTSASCSAISVQINLNLVMLIM
jgi:hypothetical protein